MSGRSDRKSQRKTAVKRPAPKVPAHARVETPRQSPTHIPRRHEVEVPRQTPTETR